MKKSSAPSKQTRMKREKTCQSSSGVQDPLILFARRYQAFFDATHDAIAVFNPKGEILDANPQLLKISGYPYDVIVSKSFQDLFDEAYWKDILGRFKTLMKGGQRKYPLECLLVSQSRKHRFVEMNLTLLKDQYGYDKTILAVMHDVSRRKEAERRLVEQAEELQSVFDTVHAILIVLDERKRIRRMNRSGLKALGRREKEVIGKKVGDALNCPNRFMTKRGCGFGVHARKCQINESITRCLKVGETVLDVEQAIARQHREGMSFTFRVNVVPLETRGKRWCVVSLEDVTDRRKAENEALQLHNSITRVNLELKRTLDDLAKSQSQLLESQKLEQIGLLASGLAHNLKTPLSGIKGYAQLLKMDHETLYELDMIVNEVDVMESIINNLMLKSRKGHESKEKILNLNDLLRIELEFLSANMFFKHRVKSVVEYDDDLPLIRGVYAHFSQTIMNVIQNALDAMHESSEKQLTVRTRHDDQYIFIDVIDTGCGIPGEIRDKVFDVFFTTKPTSMEKKGNEPYGTGLGLSTANYFMHQYGGTIEIASKKGEGTAVSIKVPHAKKKTWSSRHRVLIVDDSDSMVDILTQVCHTMGIEAFGTNDGDKGLKLYEKIKPHVVVSDLCIPGLMGSEMMSHIRRSNPDQRVIYISGYFENPEFRDWLAQETKQPHLVEVLKKPFALDRFKSVMEKMISG
jgi:two-component system NtrC family sensor kinase